MDAAHCVQKIAEDSGVTQATATFPAVGPGIGPGFRWAIIGGISTSLGGNDTDLTFDINLIPGSPMRFSGDVRDPTVGVNRRGTYFPAAPVPASPAFSASIVATSNLAAILIVGFALRQRIKG